MFIINRLKNLFFSCKKWLIKYFKYFKSSLGIFVIINVILFFITKNLDNVYINLVFVANNIISKPWTLITNIFVHSNTDDSHIIFNTLFLCFVGFFFIRLFGEKKFLLIYFIGGILGSIVFMLFALYTPIIPPNSELKGVSGAICALAVTLLVVNPKKLLFWFICILLCIASIPKFEPSVAWQAHLGGLIIGLIAGLFFRRSRRLHIWLRRTS